MRKCLMLVVVLMSMASYAFTDKRAEQILQLAENGVPGTSAEGEEETTIIDDNGNLKIVPKSSIPAPSENNVAPTAPAEAPPSSENVSPAKSN